jgi:hypothetical protein
MVKATAAPEVVEVAGLPELGEAPDEELEALFAEFTPEDTGETVEDVTVVLVLSPETMNRVIWSTVAELLEVVVGAGAEEDETIEDETAEETIVVDIEEDIDEGIPLEDGTDPVSVLLFRSPDASN